VLIRLSKVQVVAGKKRGADVDAVYRWGVGQRKKRVDNWGAGTEMVDVFSVGAEDKNNVKGV
jgi:hypothetical protein